MFNSEKFIRDSVLAALNLADSQNESKKLSVEILVAMAMEYAKKTIGVVFGYFLSFSIKLPTVSIINSFLLTNGLV